MPKADGTPYTTDQGKRYEAYIASKEWAAKRREYWQQYGRTCKVVDCGSTSDLEVHHHTYARLGDELLTDLVGVCRAHHEEIHAQHTALDRQVSLTIVTERVTGLHLRSATRAKKARKSAKKPVSMLQLERKHRNGPPKTACKCRSCRPPQETAGKQVGILDTTGRRERERQLTPKQRKKVQKARGGGSKKQQERQEVMTRRAATIKAHQQAQEVARRIAASRAK